MKSQSPFDRYATLTQQTWSAVSILLLRVALGLQFLFAGLDKFGDWSAEGYLLGSTGPFAGLFQSMAGNPLVDQLNIWGLTLIGLSLILGAFVRPASFFGALLMLLYYFAQFEQNTAHGLIDDHLINILVFIFFMAGGAGHVFGLDALLHRYLPKKKRLANVLFG